MEGILPRTFCNERTISRIWPVLPLDLETTLSWNSNGYGIVLTIDLDMMDWRSLMVLLFLLMLLMLSGNLNVVYRLGRGGTF